MWPEVDSVSRRHAMLYMEDAAVPATLAPQTAPTS